MEDNILGYIAEAESRAAEMKAQAQDKAASIIAEAEKTAADIARTSERDCASFREESLKRAESKAGADYEKTISDSRAEAESYAQSVLKFASIHVSGIVGRLTK